MPDQPTSSALFRLCLHLVVTAEQEMFEREVRQALGGKAQWHYWTYVDEEHVLIATGMYRFKTPDIPLPVVQKLGRLVRKLSDWRPDRYMWANPGVAG